jgi:hypothetical protein
MAKDDTTIVASGRYTVEYAVRDDGSMPASEFFDRLAKEDQAYLLARFQHVAMQGPLINKKVFRREREGIWAFKRTTLADPAGGKGLIRMPCFRLNMRWLLTHGFWKPKNDSKWPESEFRLAFEIREEVLKREKRERDTLA